MFPQYPICTTYTVCWFLQGQEILSQSSQANTTSREEDEEEEGEVGVNSDNLESRTLSLLQTCEDGSSTTTTTVTRRDDILDSDSEERED